MFIGKKRGRETIRFLPLGVGNGTKRSDCRAAHGEHEGDIVPLAISIRILLYPAIRKELPPFFREKISTAVSLALA